MEDAKVGSLNALEKHGNVTVNRSMRSSSAIKIIRAIDRVDEGGCLQNIKG